MSRSGGSSEGGVGDFLPYIPWTTLNTYIPVSWRTSLVHCVWIIRRYWDSQLYRDMKFWGKFVDTVYNLYRYYTLMDFEIVRPTSRSDLICVKAKPYPGQIIHSRRWFGYAWVRKTFITAVDVLFKFIHNILLWMFFKKTGATCVSSNYWYCEFNI